ncbi:MULTISPECIES: HPr kinase/phosphorylase [unclassified Ruegeria]|uniref:HPr kinase/phosphorylase n=1 Tax=unclassified Ruegeria TaxID=2625375 RepID=UPI001488E579|nr:MULTISPECIES: HPr kinase/phosphatase C-terminal domain-containing protein [unclassified Ruegeria]NOD65283.1 serine kinase [Ruegeria sp. HKCCD6109]
MQTDLLSDAKNLDKACVHASCVSVEGRGVLIIGASGTGKSGLALQMMAFGTDLVADDRVILEMVEERVIASAVPHLRGLIEARHIGLLKTPAVESTPVTYVVDLSQSEPARFPEQITVQVLRQTVPLLRGAGVPNLAAALVQLLKYGRVDAEWPNT